MSNPQESGPTEPGAAVPFLPIPVGELELSNLDSVPAANAHGQISVLVRIHGVPLGSVSLFAPDPSGAPVDLPAKALAAYGDALRVHLQGDGQPGDDLLAEAAATTWSCADQPAGSERRVSVVICTLGEDERLRQTVETVLEQTHTQFELIVVDNNPASGGVSALLDGISDPRLRIVPEPRRGLSVARNAGLAAATADLIAFTDDDAFADPQWLRQLIQPFDEHPGVQCVTGLVLPAELATTAQVWFEEFGAFDKGFERVVWHDGATDEQLAQLGTPGQRSALFPYSAGVYGSGNNMAFRTEWLRSHGGFDVALGAGSLTRGGEDLDAFLTVMLGGGTIVYEPRAVIRHYARADAAALRKQMYGYGSGMSAVIAKYFVASPRSAFNILARIPAGARRLLDPRSEKNEKKTAEYPQELGRTELSGYLAGPVLYVRGRRDARRRGLSTPSPTS